ncbi:MAG: helix-turn-helix domain-containing protein [Leptospiraceae bacterium]|nr:helix-turn-helix domain-containing protein [Leptospiraceae bacterium]MCP5501077.1 helix-turn-helix domain-containing protein [Leptospiraceae bacterium]
MNKEDFKALFSYLNTTQKDFAAKYGMQTSHLSEIVNGKGRKFPIEVVARLYKEHNISIEWLTSGTGSMLEVKGSDALSDKEKEILGELRKDPRLLDTIKNLIDSLKKNYK